MDLDDDENKIAMTLPRHAASLHDQLRNVWQTLRSASVSIEEIGRGLTHSIGKLPVFQTKFEQL